MIKQKKVANPVKKPAEDKNQQPLVSVVIPTHNVEGYVDACIASIKRQTYAALEVILIDDGSSDSTVEVILKNTADDPRFTLLRQTNLGPGAARNAGLRKATGKYLSFIDADDVAEPSFIERMVASLEKSGSDLAVCNVWRLRNGKLYEAELFKKAIPSAAVGTHIKNHPSLVWDTVVWNKVYRLNFYLEKVGFFPEGILYEDMPPATLAHLKAKTIDIVDERLYCWRYRTEETSITQNKFDLKNLVDRLDVMENLFRLYKEECPSLLPEFEKKQLENDLLMYLRLYPKASDDFKRVCAQRVPPLLQSFSPQSIKSVAVGLRLFYTLASLGRLANVGKALDAAGNPVSSYKVTQEGGRLYAVLPFCGGWDALPKALFDVTDELAIQAEVTKIEADTHGCQITGATRIENLPVESLDAAEIGLFLKHTKTGATIPLRVERFKAEPPASGARPLHDYGWSSYRVTISYVDLAVPSAPAGEWTLISSISSANIQRQAAPVSLPKSLPSKQVGGSWVRVDGTSGALTVFTERASIVAEEAQFDAKGALQVQLYSKIADLKAIRVRVSADSPFSDWPLGRLPKSLWRTTIPEDALKPFFNAKNEVALEVLALDAAGKPFRIKRPSTTSLSEYVGQDGSVHKTLESPYGNLFIRSEKNLNLASSISIFQGRLFVEGQVGSSGETPTDFRLRNVKTGAVFSLPTTYWKNTFQSALDLLDVARAPLTRGPLPVGQYEFVFTLAGQTTVLTALKDQSFQGLTPADGLQYKISIAPYSNSANLVYLSVMNRLAADESGEAAQARMRDQIYAPALLKSVKKVVLFDSFSGKRVDCNPFGIWRELSKVKGLDLRFSTADGSVILPKGVKPVKRWSKEYWELLGSSAMVITNDWLPKAVKRRKNQTIVQTWHGTPLKRIGFDIQQPSFDPNYHATLANDVAKWDILLSQNAFSTPHLRSAFNFKGEICEYGYPRNDMLRSAGAEGVRAKLRAALHIADKQTAMLYAPTWRDDQREGPGAYRLELGLDLDKLLREHPNMVILARWHHLTVPEARFSGHPRVLDVSAYPDIADLFLAADLLVTDYSSTMVDFSVTKKPILYFVPDLEKYTDKLRGFYIDFVSEVPGPLCKTTDELIYNLGAERLKRLSEEYQGKYSAWCAKYCALDDGKAGYRMADRLLPMIL